MNYGIDIGYGNIKGVAENGNKILFPTLLKPFCKKIDQDLAGFKYLVKINKKTYRVGEFANMGNNAERSLSKDHQLDEDKVAVFLGTALNLLSDSTDSVEHLNLCVGLPVDFYSTQKDLLKDMLEGLEIDTEIDGKVKKFIIDTVIVSQQSVSAFLSLYLNIDGTPKQADVIDKDFYRFGGAIGDVGYNTYDPIRIIKNGSKFVLVDDESGTYEGFGATFAHEEATRSINNYLGCQFDASYYENILFQNNGEFFIGGKVENIKPFFDTAYEMLANEIKAINLKLWKDMPSFGAYVLTGGSANEVSKYIKHKNTKTIVQGDSIFANAEGLLIKLNLFLKKKLATIKKPDNSLAVSK